MHADPCGQARCASDQNAQGSSCLPGQSAAGCWLPRPARANPKRARLQTTHACSPTYWSDDARA